MIKIDRKEDCCGCGSCYNACPKQCIEMRYDNEGFLYPFVDESNCVECGLCIKSCPIQNKKNADRQFERSAVIVQHKNNEICAQSTAGGAFTGIAEYVIENSGIVFGVEMDHNCYVHHIAVENKQDLYKFRNSKYVQSDVEDTFKQVKKYLENGRLVCYSGTPCQIEGLLNYLNNNEYENLILVDVVCRAVPSPGIWKKYVDMIEEKRGKIKSVRFRDKTLGYQYSTMEIKDEKGGVDRGGIESQPWLRMFFSGMIIRPSCTECKFRSMYRRSDFTIWDCFNIYHIDRAFDEDIGTTRVLIHSQKAKDLFEKIKEKYIYRFISVEAAVSNVAELNKSPNAHDNKRLFIEDINKYNTQDVIDKYFPKTFKVKIKRISRLVLNKFGLDKIVKHILTNR